MAKGGYAKFDIDATGFIKSLNVTMSRVERATKKATIQACEEILADSLEEVPTDTFALFDSASYEIYGTSPEFHGVVGYGLNGDPYNEKSRSRVSDYMVRVHEDLTAIHKIGKAKFLEDPVRAYQRRMAPNYEKLLRAEKVFYGGR